MGGSIAAFSYPGVNAAAPILINPLPKCWLGRLSSAYRQARLAIGARAAESDSQIRNPAPPRANAGGSHPCQEQPIRLEPRKHLAGVAKVMDDGGLGEPSRNRNDYSAEPRDTGEICARPLRHDELCRCAPSHVLDPIVAIDEPDFFCLCGAFTFHREELVYVPDVRKRVRPTEKKFD